MTVNVELLWFEDCPNHVATDALIREVLHELGLRAPVHRIEVPDEPTGNRVRFPGSPTVRVNGRDIEPGFDPNICVDCAPRCRLYLTSEGLRGAPERAWIHSALTAAIGAG